jgi:hypothetical protein
MSDTTGGNAKLGAAVVGGYLLGRFKKGRQAMRLAAYLNGGQTPPQMVLGLGRQGASSVMENAQAKEIVDQIRGPLMKAIQDIAIAQVNSRVTKLSTGLENRTKELTEGAAQKGKEVVDTTADTAKEGGKGIVGRLRGKGKGSDEEAEGEEAAGEETGDEKQPDEKQPAAATDEPEEEPEPEEPEPVPTEEEEAKSRG